MERHSDPPPTTQGATRSLFYEVKMTPIHRIAKDMTEDMVIKKMTRDTYAKLLRNEEDARERAERYKKCRAA